MFQIISDVGGITTAHIGDGMRVSWDSRLLQPPWDDFMHPEVNPMYVYMNDLVRNAKRSWLFQHSTDPDKPAPLELMKEVWTPKEMRDKVLRQEDFEVNE